MSSHLRRLANAKKIRRTPPRPDSEQENQVETSALDVQNIVQMQSIVGNRAVQRLIDKGFFTQTSSHTPAHQPAQAVSPALANASARASSGLQIRRQLRQMPLQRAVIQRAAVGTWAGDWDTDKYDIVKTGKGKEIGVDIELRFTPNKKANATKIGTLQSVQSRIAGTAIAINNDPTIKSRMIPAGQPDAGFQIDQATHNRNPLYAVEGAPATDTELTQTGAGATWGQHGYRYKDATGTEQKQDALLKDTPKLGARGADASQKFETTALAISGDQEGTYYGSVQWGWETDGTGKFTKLPLTLVSNDVPSATFNQAGEIWNTGKNDAGEDNLDLPIVEGKYTNTPGVHLVSNPNQYQATRLRNLALNTRLEVTNKGDKKPFNNVADNLKWWKVTIVDGTAAGMVGWVMQANLGDNKVKPAGTP